MLSSSRETLANFDVGVGKSSKFLKPFPLLLLFSLWYLSCLLRYPQASLFWTGSCRKETELELQISNFQKNPNKSRWVCPQLYLTPTLVRNFRSSSGVNQKKVCYAFWGLLSSSSDIFVLFAITLIYLQCCTYERHIAKVTYSTV